MMTSIWKVFQRRTGLGMILAVSAGLLATQPAGAQLRQGDFLCTYGASYKIVWDGWKGDLTLYYPAYPDNTPKGVLTSGGKTFPVRYQILANPQDYIDGSQGPGYKGTNSTAQHRVVFWVDFNNTPYNPFDDQKFDGYMMTQTRNAIAGVTWWNGMVFGFYASNKQCIVG